ncbi:hypothetical protein LCGC14_2860310 [marine sediment metagenome]|uniref:Uncharacterized protein n=1 Tax=marine sediment metagenome TaxID=412755 RepID=A0A0F8Y5Q5_9ZZZZ
MTAEEKLKELYEACKPPKQTPEMIKKEEYWNASNFRGVFLDPEHIDLIANLVVERLKKEDK